jgi:hypothetical protein
MILNIIIKKKGNTIYIQKQFFLQRSMWKYQFYVSSEHVYFGNFVGRARTLVGW